MKTRTRNYFFQIRIPVVKNISFPVYDMNVFVKYISSQKT